MLAYLLNSVKCFSAVFLRIRINADKTYPSTAFVITSDGAAHNPHRRLTNECGMAIMLRDACPGPVGRIMSWNR